MKRIRVVWIGALGVGLAGCSVPEYPLREDVTTNPPRIKHIPKVNITEPVKSSPYWKRAYKEVYLKPEEIDAQIAKGAAPEKSLSIIRQGLPNQRSLAITFDDGPHPGYTLRLLEILKRRKVKATFFLVGKQAEKYPALVRAIQRDGHEIGNHTFSHVDLTRLSSRDVDTEYRACSDILKSITGITPKLCRPPGGNFNDEVIQAAMGNGMTTVFWTNDPGDYARPTAKVLAERAMANLRNGSILLFHGGIEETLDCLPILFDYANSKVFEWETVSDVLIAP
jgi:peptidoglycan/xylan/chitin deacetylase (PgdA/CDA1 family)